MTIKSALIIGVTGIGKTVKLEEMLESVPSEVKINLCEPFGQDIKHDELVNLNDKNFDVNTICDGKSLLVIDELSFYKNSVVPYELPVIATMQARSKEEATERIKKLNIDIKFEKVIVIRLVNGEREIEEFDF